MVTKLKQIYTALKRDPRVTFVGKPKERINLHIDPVHDLEFVVASKTPLLGVDGLNEILESVSSDLEDTRCYNKKFSDLYSELRLGHLHYYEPVGKATKTTNRIIDDAYLKKKISSKELAEERTSKLERSIKVYLYPSVQLARYAIKKRDESYYKHLDEEIPNRVWSWFHPQRTKVQQLPYKPRLHSKQQDDGVYTVGYVIANGTRFALLNIKDLCAAPCNELIEDKYVNIEVRKPTGKAIIHRFAKKHDAETYNVYKKLKITKEK